MTYRGGVRRQIVDDQSTVAPSRGPIVDDQSTVAPSRGPIVDDQTAVAPLRGPIVDDQTAVAPSRGPIVDDQSALAPLHEPIVDDQSAAATCVSSLTTINRLSQPCNGISTAFHLLTSSSFCLYSLLIDERSFDSFIAQKFGPHIVQYSPSSCLPSWK